MQLRDILPRLSGVRKGRQGYVAKCPTHDDKKQSLALAEDNGRVLIKCYASCDTKAVLNSLGLEWRDLFDRNISQPSHSSLGASDERNKKPFSRDFVGYTPSPGKREHSVYPYFDENGNVLYENVRFFPKDFRPRRLDENGNPIWNLEGVRRVPYRLPDLSDPEPRDIFLTEGEKDADALAEIGFTASSFKNWNEDFNQYLNGNHIIIVQDHDIPGTTMANEAAKLIYKTVASVKILDVFANREMPEKHGLDISDYIAECVHDEAMDIDAIKERLCLMVDQTPIWKDNSAMKAEEYFVVQSGNAWMSQSKSQPIPKKLFGEFWFENELCILFADTNVGKSILAVQIADRISRGTSSDLVTSGEGRVTSVSSETGNEGRRTSKMGIASGLTASESDHPKDPESERTSFSPLVTRHSSLNSECEAQKVVYFDFELTAKQFESRFSERLDGSDEFVDHYEFHRNFYRAEINPETSDIGSFQKFEDFLNHALETTVVSSGTKILIIDNLTYLRDETENARNALPLMKYLKSLKAKYGLSILALAHTPKRDSSKPLGRNDLQGSKMLINFCDSSFAIGESAKNVGMRYLKQIKARNTENIYHAENVLMASIVKSNSFLHFEFQDTDIETDHLKVQSDKKRSENIVDAKRMSAEGMTQSQIAEVLGVTQVSVSRYLKS